MPWVSRSFFALSFLGLLLLVAHARPQWFRCLGFDVGTLADDMGRLKREDERQKDLDTFRDRLLESMKARTELYAALVEQRTTLPEAAQRFCDLAVGPPEIIDSALPYFKGKSEGERICRLLIHSIAILAEDQPEKYGPAVTRLEAELEAYLARHGTVALSRPHVSAEAAPQ